MITVLASPPAALARWSDLAHELDRWAQEGRIATLWWRDDDAAAPSRHLDDLLALAGKVSVALAVIPGLADQALAARLGRPAASQARVLQHGWRHVHHASGGKKSEFPASRSPEKVADDLAQGRARLSALFGSRALAVLAPPWNRFEDAFLPLLAAGGIRALSRVNPRPIFASPNCWRIAIIFVAGGTAPLRFAHLLTDDGSFTPGLTGLVRVWPPDLVGRAASLGFAFVVTPS